LGERERMREKSVFFIYKKSFSSPVAHPGEEEEQCRLKRHYFRFLLVFFEEKELN
jgi:hypothetical protein